MRHLPAGPETGHWGHFDPASSPVLTIDPGEEVVIETLSGGARNLPQKGEGQVLPAHARVIAECRPHLGPHYLTGPVAVRGAEPGDRLIVEILGIELAQDWGWNAVEPGFGLFPEMAETYETLAVPIDIATATARLPWGAVAALKPFFGIMAVAPDPELGMVGSVAPGPFGGNIDNKLARPGMRIDFPVFRPGALFSVGDGHAIQGDGEVCDTALETALNGRFRFRLEKGTAPEAPELHGPERVVTMAFDEDLNRATQDATRRMIDLICARSALTRVEAWRHCSLFADLRITQVVNRRKGVHCVLDPRTLPGGAG